MASSLAAGAVRHLPRWPRAPRVTAEDRRDARLLMETVYGRWRALPPGARFVPRPLPPGEAAEAPGGQRRYLWTDAFAVLNLVTDAARCGDEGDEGGRAAALEAALALVETTTRTLGSPRAPDLPMAPSEYPPFTLDPVVPQTPHRANGRKPRWRGLRIGKRLAAKSSDPGMALDGQYFHYVDKWLVALARLASELPEDDPRRVRVATEAVHVVKDVHPHFIEREPFSNGPSIDAFSADRDARQETRVGAPIGVRWKINADASPVVGLPRARPSSDAISGSIAYGLVDRAARAAGVRVPIEHERGEMRRIARALSPGVSLDALGWGLQAWEAQWLARDDRDADAGGAASDAEADGRWAEFARDVRSRRAFDRVVAGDPARTGLPFRAYGAYLGARVSGVDDIGDAAAGLARDAARRELRKALAEDPFDDGSKTGESGPSPFSDDLTAINRVMLASALDPLAFTRRADDPMAFDRAAR